MLVHTCLQQIAARLQQTTPQLRSMHTLHSRSEWPLERAPAHDAPTREADRVAISPVRFTFPPRTILLMVATAITAAATLCGVALTLIFTNRRERDRLEHERLTRLQDERTRAYSSLLRVTATPSHKDAARRKIEVEEAYSEVELVTNNANLQDAAYELALIMREALDYTDELNNQQFIKSQTPMQRESEDQRRARIQDEYHDARIKFVRLARAELGRPPRPHLDD